MMNRFGVVLGVAAVATLAGCKDPNYVRGGGAPSAATEVKSAEAQPVTIETTTVSKCLCAPGTTHTSPCLCGASDCKCKVVPPPAVKPAKPIAMPPPPPPPPASAPLTTTYVVQPGDSLSKIAYRYGLRQSEILKLNPKVKKDVVRVGMKLKLPGVVNVGEQKVKGAKAVRAGAPKKAPYAAYTGATKEYVVKSGDSIGAIAYANGLNIRQLKELNGLKNNNLRIGQKLKIPSEKVVHSAKKAAAPAKGKAADAAKSPAPAAGEAAPAANAVAPAPVAGEAAPAADAAAPATGAAPAGEAAAPAAGAAAPTAAAPAAPATTTYVVQEGDDLTGVSIRWGVSTATIRELNNLSDDAQLAPGQILKLPADAQP